MKQIAAFIVTHWENIVVLIWFFICFRGYALFASRAAKTTNCLARMLHQYRLEWMHQLLQREHRVADASFIANLERSVTFFASTTMLILAGLITVLGSTDKAIDVVSDIPFVTQASTAEWEMKLLLLILVFSYAFFKFTWSLRQYGFASVMIGATPMSGSELSESASHAHAKRNANMMSLAANNFNKGLRTYYFSLAILTWFINSWLFAAMSLFMVWILYRREFRSRTLYELTLSRP